MAQTDLELVLPPASPSSVGITNVSSCLATVVWEGKKQQSACL